MRKPLLFLIIALLTSAASAEAASSCRPTLGPKYAEFSQALGRYDTLLKRAEADGVASEADWKARALSKSLTTAMLYFEAVSPKGDYERALDEIAAYAHKNPTLYKNFAEEIEDGWAECHLPDWQKNQLHLMRDYDRQMEIALFAVAMLGGSSVIEGWRVKEAITTDHYLQAARALFSGGVTARIGTALRPIEVANLPRPPGDKIRVFPHMDQMTFLESYRANQAQIFASWVAGNAAFFVTYAALGAATTLIAPEVGKSSQPLLTWLGKLIISAIASDIAVSATNNVLIHQETQAQLDELRESVEGVERVAKAGKSSRDGLQAVVRLNIAIESIAARRNRNLLMEAFDFEDQFYSRFNQLGIAPVIGCADYMLPAPQAPAQDASAEDRSRYRQVMTARNDATLQKICKDHRKAVGQALIVDDFGDGLASMGNPLANSISGHEDASGDARLPVPISPVFAMERVRQWAIAEGGRILDANERYRLKPIILGQANLNAKLPDPRSFVRSFTDPALFGESAAESCRNAPGWSRGEDCGWDPPYQYWGARWLSAAEHAFSNPMIAPGSPGQEKALEQEITAWDRWKNDQIHAAVKDSQARTWHIETDSLYWQIGQYLKYLGPQWLAEEGDHMIEKAKGWADQVTDSMPLKGPAHVF